MNIRLLHPSVCTLLMILCESMFPRDFLTPMFFLSIKKISSRCCAVRRERQIIFKLFSNSKFSQDFNPIKDCQDRAKSSSMILLYRRYYFADILPIFRHKMSDPSDIMKMRGILCALAHTTRRITELSSCLFRWKKKR